LIPQNLKMPVKGATESDYNANSFWFYPWGKSVTHKGVDIFAKKELQLIPRRQAWFCIPEKFVWVVKLFWCLVQNGGYIIMRI